MITTLTVIGAILLFIGAVILVAAVAAVGVAMYVLFSIIDAIINR